MRTILSFLRNILAVVGLLAAIVAAIAAATGNLQKIGSDLGVGGRKSERNTTTKESSPPAEEPPEVESLPPPSENPPKSTIAWKYRPFSSADAASAELSLQAEQPVPQDVYAITQDGKTFQLWWKPSQSGYKYRPTYVDWDPNDPTKIPLPSSAASQVPIGFGSRKVSSKKKQKIFLFFETSK